MALAGRVPLEIAVTGRSSSAAFVSTLRAAGVPVYRTSDSRDCFDHAEALVRRVAASPIATVCFWNVDAKVKLLLAKTLGWTSVKLIDVSPGDFAFDEMAATGDFQRWIAFSAAQYAGPSRSAGAEVPRPGAARAPDDRHSQRRPRSAPAEESLRCAATPPRGQRRASRRRSSCSRSWPRGVWCAPRVPGVELHMLGPAETRHRDYADRVLAAAGDDLDRGVFVHGATPDAPERLADYDVAVVLGESQGCPNAVLEALAAGVPVVANDSGGTRELIIDGRTGLLDSARAIPQPSPPR